MQYAKPNFHTFDQRQSAKKAQYCPLRYSGKENVFSEGSNSKLMNYSG